jgi:hypothetical protein
MRKTGLTELLLVSDVGTVKIYSGHSQASTLLKHYVSPELESVREANKRREEKLKGYFPQ